MLESEDINTPSIPIRIFCGRRFVATWHLRGKSFFAAALQLQFPVGFWALQMHRFWGFLALSSQWWCWMVASAARRRVAGEVFWPSWWHAIVVFERHDPIRCLQGFSGCRHRSVPATAILTASLWLVAEIGPLLRGRFESRHQLRWIAVDRVHVDVHAPILEVDCVIFLAEEPSRFIQLGNVW